MGRKRQELAAECTRIAQAEWERFIIRPDDEKHTDPRKAPNAPGIYAWYSDHGDLIYVGRSLSISGRLRQHRERTNFLADPRLFSYREVPSGFMAGVEVAHIDVLAPHENRYRDSFSTPFQAEMEAVIQDAWKDVLPAQRERLDALYTALNEQIARSLHRL